MTEYQSHDDQLLRLRHSSAHVMARAVLELFPGTHIGFGPATGDGFFYDFAAESPIQEEDLPAIEERMRKIITGKDQFVFRIIDIDEARHLFADQPLKLEIAEEIAAGRRIDASESGRKAEPQLSTYRVGSFEDLCRGPHVASTAEIDPEALQLLRVSGAYWRGDEKRPMLQRVYGTVWPTPAELEQHLHRLELARERDHRKLGEQLDLFAIDPNVGKGLPLWLPKGTAVRDALEDWAKETERRWGYQRVSTPHITRAGLYKVSGHLPYFTDGMYPAMSAADGDYYLRPMNCPHHMAVFAARPHSYRELPIRYAEYGTVYRYEQSGELHGLLRVRGLTQNDAHIFCRLDQAREEFLDAIRLHTYYYEVLGIEDYHMVLALRDPANRDKYHDDEQMWQTAERITREAMEESGIPYVEELGGAAHYGPKIDFVLTSVTGRQYGASTSQLDLYLPMRFDLSFVNERNEPERPAVIHRAPLGSHERFIGFLIEHYGGAFPVWLAPVQVKVIPVNASHEESADGLAQRLIDRRVRVEVQQGGGTVGAAIRTAEQEKIPFMVIIGDRERDSDSITVRARGGAHLGTFPTDEFLARLDQTIASKTHEIELVG
jgi:threonyl-tRNA synthetase